MGYELWVLSRESQVMGLESQVSSRGSIEQGNNIWI